MAPGVLAGRVRSCIQKCHQLLALVFSRLDGGIMLPFLSVGALFPLS